MTESILRVLGVDLGQAADQPAAVLLERRRRKHPPA